MPFPKHIRVIDLHLGIPESETRSEWYAPFKPLLMDEKSRHELEMPAQFLFKHLPKVDSERGYVQGVIDAMDKHNIEIGLINVFEGFPYFDEIEQRFPDRFMFSLAVNPNLGMEEIRRIKRLHKERAVKALSYFPAGSYPQVAIDDKKMFPIYATCVELGLPILVNVGVPGPRIPMATQRPELIDEVCWFFPELVFIMRHGAEPWVDLAIKLMLKYPNLYYSTSAFAPKHYPAALIDYANTRGADKVLFAGYFPAGLSLDRIFSELQDVPFKPEVWPKFLRDNAGRIFNLGPAAHQ